MERKDLWMEICFISVFNHPDIHLDIRVYPWMDLSRILDLGMIVCLWLKSSEFRSRGLVIQPIKNGYFLGDRLKF